MARILIALIGLSLLAMGTSASAAQRVLFLGDSLSMGAFGTTLDKRLRESGLEVYTSVTGGATPWYWLQEFPPMPTDIGHWKKTPKEDQRYKVLDETPKVEALIAAYKPDAVIVQTGTNLYSTLRSAKTTPEQAQTKVLSLMQKMAAAITSRGCALYWITPASAHPERFPVDLQRLMLNLTKRAVGTSGHVFDSYAVTTYKDAYPAEGNDGIHYGPTEAAAWAEIVAPDAISFLKTTPAPKAPKAMSNPKASSPPVAPRARIVEDEPEADSNALTAEIRLVRKSDFSTPSEITYNNALAIYEWEILRIIEGTHSSKRILVAHQVVKGRKITLERDLKLGKTYIVQLVPLSTYPNVESWQTIDKISQDFSRQATIYIPKMDP
jgi:hypothetical protein